MAVRSVPHPLLLQEALPQPQQEDVLRQGKAGARQQQPVPGHLQVHVQRHRARSHAGDHGAGRACRHHPQRLADAQLHRQLSLHPVRSRLPRLLPAAALASGLRHLHRQLQVGDQAEAHRRAGPQVRGPRSDRAHRGSDCLPALHLPTRLRPRARPDHPRRMPRDNLLRPERVLDAMDEREEHREEEDWERQHDSLLERGDRVAEHLR
mmetsp:Transcript_47398/g.148266  ORF Transcript_47398/g.148266 Transcript_47398/m.148266 type:complete len:208 (-) Transcript_47398:1669-2292(-)